MTNETIKPVQESGAWDVGMNANGSFYIESDDFTHDVRLLLSGDFESREQRHMYCREIAQRLNEFQAALDRTYNEALERAAEVCLKSDRYRGDYFCNKILALRKGTK